MASRYPEHDIFPKEGIDLRDTAGTEWLANVWRPERAMRIAVRPGFGQLTQQDCTAEKANIAGGALAPATGGYQKHLGSYLYNTNFGHRQIISVFETIVQYSGSDDPGVGTAPTYWERAFETVHGAAKTAVVSIFDLTTGAQWEEVLIIHTSENCNASDIPYAHGHWETDGATSSSIPSDFIKFHFHPETTDASFTQMGDSVVMMLGAYGVWVYHGIDVAKTKQRVLDSANMVPNNFGASFAVGTNYPTGDCEGSIIKPVRGTRGLNGEDFTYFSKAEFPKAHAAAFSKGRMVYALRGVLYFSDVGQPGAIMADNFGEIQTEGNITAIGEYSGQLFAFTETEAHLINVQQDNRAGPAFANVVKLSHVRISKRTGCVGPRSLVETPFGVCWVSSKGCHIAGAEQSVQDLSDPIQDYWDAGIINPTSHYYEHAGAGGAATQPSVIYKHKGKPTMGYEPQTESLLVAYDDHLLVYQFRHKAWTIWPLAATNQPTDVLAVTNNLVSSYLPATQTTTTWSDSTDANNMIGAVTAPPVFDGNDFYTIGNPANLQFANHFTVEAWASQDAGASGFERLISRDNGGARCFILSQRDDTGAPFAAIFVGNVLKAVTGTGAYADGNWHHYVVTHDGVFLRLYVDGVHEGQTATGGPMDNDVVDWEVGREQTGSDYLEGRCDTVRFYSGTLTASQVLQNYNAGLIAHGGSASPPQSRQTINCLEVLSDSQGTYLVGGLFDQDETGLSPALQSSSYYLTALGRGGAMDRNCGDEDHRRYGWGRYTYAIDPSGVLLLDPGFLWSLEKPQRIYTTDDGAKIIYEFPVYLECMRNSLWPPNVGVGLPEVKLSLSWNAAFTFEGIGIFPESSPRSEWTFTNTANSFTAERSTPGSGAASQITTYRMPMFVLRVSAPVGTSARTDFSVVYAQVVDVGGGFWDITRVLLWQQQHLYAPPTMSNDDRLATSVEWGYKTGQIGLNEGKEIRVRGINTVMESSTSASSTLYNSYTVSDYKRLSGQFPDYADYTPGNRKQVQLDLLRERMLVGRRVFNSLARWAPTTAVNTPYLIDSPEMNGLVTSVSGRGEHLSVGLYGFASDKADELSMHRMTIAVLDTGNRRRKGR